MCNSPAVSAGLLSFSDHAVGRRRLYAIINWRTSLVSSFVIRYGACHTGAMTPNDLTAALQQSQRLGFLGDRPIDEVIDHAGGFVEALTDVTGCVVDLGSGGGVPGLVIACARPDLELTLVDRRTKRTDFLDRMIHKYGLRERVHVEATDTGQLINASSSHFDAAVARGFGPPMMTLSTGARLVKVGGIVVISEPPVGDRWDVAGLSELGVERVFTAGGVVVFRRTV